VLPILAMLAPLLLVIKHFDKIKAVATNVFNWVKDKAEMVVDWFKTSGIGKIIAAPFVWAFEKVKGVFEFIQEKLGFIGDALSTIKDTVGGFLGIGGDEHKLGDVNIPHTFKGPQGPHGPTGGGGGKKPPRSGGPHIRPRPKMRSGRDFELKIGGGSRDLHLTLVNTIDGKEVSRRTTKHALDAEARG
jgi:hypothetical protein